MVVRMLLVGSLPNLTGCGGIEIIDPISEVHYADPSGVPDILRGFVAGFQGSEGTGKIADDSQDIEYRLGDGLGFGQVLR